MSKGDFHWYKTRLIERHVATVVVVMDLILCALLALVYAGFTSATIAIIAALLVVVGGGIGYYLEFRDVLKRDPTHVGLSTKGIRLLYHERHHEDIPWNDIDGIVVQGLWTPIRIILKDGSSRTVVIPSRITTAMKMKFQEIKSTVGKVD